jgi:hypothetical protein
MAVRQGFKGLTSGLLRHEDRVTEYSTRHCRFQRVFWQVRNEVLYNHTCYPLCDRLQMMATDPEVRVRFMWYQIF